MTSRSHRDAICRLDQYLVAAGDGLASRAQSESGVLTQLRHLLRRPRRSDGVTPAPGLVDPDWKLRTGPNGTRGVF
jgi:hypothetical protein